MTTKVWRSQQKSLWCNNFWFERCANYYRQYRFANCKLKIEKNEKLKFWARRYRFRVNEIERNNDHNRNCWLLQVVVMRQTAAVKRKVVNCCKQRTIVDKRSQSIRLLKFSTLSIENVIERRKIKIW